MTVHPAIANLSPERRSKGIWWQRSWNVVRGCSHVSPGCDNCWLESETARHAKHPNPKIALPCWPAITAGKWSGNVHMDLLALSKPLTIQKPTVWAVWSDLFHEQVTDEFLDRVFAVMALSPRHLFVVLTKRPKRMREYLTARSRDEQVKALELAAMAMFGEDGANMLVNAINGVLAERHNVGWPMRNLWLGVTAENQEQADAGVPILLCTPAAKRFVSVEPMLGRIELDALGKERSYTLDSLRGRFESNDPQLLNPEPPILGNRLDWVIAGGESGPGSRPMHPDWLRSLRDQCAAAGVPFLLKQWGDFQLGSDLKAPPVCVYRDGRAVPATPQAIKTEERRSGIYHGEVGNNPVIMARVGKRAAGRLLDGVTHDAYPGEAA